MIYKYSMYEFIKLYASFVFSLYLLNDAGSDSCYFFNLKFIQSKDDV